MLAKAVSYCGVGALHGFWCRQASQPVGCVRRQQAHGGELVEREQQLRGVHGAVHQARLPYVDLDLWVVWELCERGRAVMFLSLLYASLCYVHHVC